MKIFDVYPINDINIVRASGCSLWDDSGVEYLDMYGGHAVISIGHTAPRYVEYLTGQLGAIGFYSNSIRIPPQQLLAERLGVLSGRADYSLFMCNSGAEANENAMKLASFHNGRRRVLAFSGSFHGRTSLAVAVTDNPKIQAPVNETPNVTFVDYGDLSALRAEFERGGVSSVIIEPVKGVGGIEIATVEFLRGVRALCDEFDAVLIADCVQCGCGRTGRYFALDHSGVSADIYSMAKGIGNGFPIGGILISPKFAAVHGMLGTTFGGNHLACAAALAVVDDMAEKNLMQNAANMGDYLMAGLRAIQADFPAKIESVCGLGLIIGVRMAFPAAAFRSEMLFTERVFISGANDPQMVRVLPPLIVSRAECDRFLAAFRNCLERGV